MEIIHIPVLLKESLEYLDVKPGGIYVDATMGAGGHGREIIKRLSPEGMLIGLDVDEKAVERAKLVLEVYANAKTFCANYIQIPQIAQRLGIKCFSGVLFDLGMSSLQVDDAERGFSIYKNGPLDMRMNRKTNLTAEYVINNYSVDELAGIFREYGEEKNAFRIAKKIVDERKNRPIKTTEDLAGIVRASVHSFQKNIHPATKIFQALRIYINREIDNLKQVIDEIWPFMCSGSRLVMISFHSLEDRVVKQSFNDAEEKKICRILTPKPVIASAGEIENNPRSRSAKLRAVEII